MRWIACATTGLRSLNLQFTACALTNALLAPDKTVLQILGQTPCGFAIVERHVA